MLKTTLKLSFLVAFIGFLMIGCEEVILSEEESIVDVEPDPNDFDQTHFYYSKGQTIPLKIIDTLNIIVFHLDSSLTIRNKLSEKGLEPRWVFDFEDGWLFCQVCSGYTMLCISNPNAISLSDIYQIDEIDYCAPYFTNENGIELGVTNILYVELSKKSDLTLLLDICKQYDVEFGEQSESNPLTYWVFCNRLSKGNALEIANLFYEKRIFAASYPAFVGGLPSR